MSLRVLVTGATGFTGRHLCRYALERGAEVFGFARFGKFEEGVDGWLGDVTNPEDVQKALAASRPQYVFHLAAQLPAQHGSSEDELVRTNCDGTYRLLEAVCQQPEDTRVLVASSSAVYGQQDAPDEPIGEDAPLRSQSRYATTKIVQEILAEEFFADDGVRTVRTRTFNQMGPGEPDSQVCSRIVRQFARIETGAQEPALDVITLAPSRDFVDVRDVVRAYWLLAEHGEAGEVYNVCSGSSVSIGQLIELLIELSGHDDIRINEQSPGGDPVGIMNQIGRAERIRECCGWRPSISVRESLADLLDEWRQRCDS